MASRLGLRCAIVSAVDKNVREIPAQRRMAPSRRVAGNLLPPPYADHTSSPHLDFRASTLRSQRVLFFFCRKDAHHSTSFSFPLTFSFSISTRFHDLLRLSFSGTVYSSFSCHSANAKVNRHLSGCAPQA